MATKFTPASLAGVSEDKTFPITEQESQKFILNRFQQWFLPSFVAEKPPLGFFCFNQNLTPRLQQGPTCGLVSLRMAAEALLGDSSVFYQNKTLLEVSKSLGFTGYGEMFSAQNMASLVSEFYSNESGAELFGTCWDLLWEQEMINSLVSGLTNRSLFLAPYDTDKNHEPCVNHGKTAHWAAIKGFILPIRDPDQLQLIETQFIDSVSKLDCLGLPFYYFSASSSNNLGLERIVPSKIEEQDLLLIAQQPKSKYQAIWKFTSLKLSNSNLKKFDESRVKDDQFVVPSELSELRGKVVQITKRDKK